jgi:hypothetical protein
VIDSILPYVGSYDNVRAAVGLDTDELPDSTLELQLYTAVLDLALNDKGGVYAPSTDYRTLQEIFDSLNDDDDPLYGPIQLYSIYTVAQAVANNLPMTAYKTKSDGKSVLTRFSAEDTYIAVMKTVNANVAKFLAAIFAILGEPVPVMPTVKRVEPTIDLVTGAPYTS